jgi:hypothetical protein
MVRMFRGWGGGGRGVTPREGVGGASVSLMRKSPRVDMGVVVLVLVIGGGGLYVIVADDNAD